MTGPIHVWSFYGGKPCADGSRRPAFVEPAPHKRDWIPAAGCFEKSEAARSLETFRRKGDLEVVTMDSFGGAMCLTPHLQIINFLGIVKQKDEELLLVKR